MFGDFAFEIITAPPRGQGINNLGAESEILGINLIQQISHYKEPLSSAPNQKETDQYLGVQWDRFNND